MNAIPTGLIAAVNSIIETIANGRDIRST
jgi:hypothetical protein